MSIVSAQIVTAMFTTCDPNTGAALDADALPTGLLYVNGVADAAVVAVANMATGVYRAVVTLPALAAGDLVAIRITATVDAIDGEGIVWQDVADIMRTSDLNKFDPAVDVVANVTTVAVLTGHTPQTGDNYARLGAPAGASVSADIAAIPTVGEIDDELTDEHGAGSWQRNTAAAAVTGAGYSAGTLTIMRGDSYNADNPLAITGLSVPLGWIDIIFAVRLGVNTEGTLIEVSEGDGIVVTDYSGVDVRIDLTADDTMLAQGKYAGALRFLYAGHRETPITFKVEIVGHAAYDSI